MEIKVKSLKHNFFMYFLRTLANMLFLILIFPYISRVLGPKNIGEIQYAESITAYCILFINLGILTYGKREVAFVREDKEKLTKVVLELLIILFITTTIGLSSYLILLKFTNFISSNKVIYYIFSLNILFNLFGVEWFYEGIENQTYISMRNIIFKIMSTILILFFVKDVGDLNKYVGILVLGLSGANILNFIKLFSYLELKKENFKFNIKKHLKPLVIFFTTALALSISYNLDSIMIMKFVGAEELGYYSFASKLGKIPVIFTSAILSIFLPRLYNTVKKDWKEYVNLSKQGLDLLLLFSVPASIGLFMIADLITIIFGGDKFSPAIILVQIFSVYIFLISIAVFVDGMTLCVNGMEKLSMISTILGSVLNFLFNIFFIRILKAEGAVIATVITELVAIISRIIMGRKLFKKMDILEINQLKILISSIMMIPIIWFVKKNIENVEMKLFFSIFGGALIYSILLISLKERNAIKYSKEIFKYVRGIK